MGSKRKRNQQAPDQLYARAKRELANGDSKEALKNAKVCYRAEASPEHRQLLEQAYVARLQQLRSRGLVAEAGAVFDELAALGPTDPEVAKQLTKFRILLGKGGLQTEQLWTEDPSLLVQITDEAVLDPRSPLPGVPEIRKQIEQIRQALQCVERGDDGAVGPLLQDIPRTSPLGDWKLLVRGLSAFYLREQERTDENWRRLDPTRPAWRIAQTLIAAADPARAQDMPAGIDAARRQLVLRLQDAGLAALMKKLADHWQQGDIEAFMRDFRTLRQLYAKTHAPLIESITEIAWKLAAQESDSYLLSQLTRFCPAPPLDPHWNRANMLTMREVVGYDELAAFERYGLDYAKDLQQVEALPPAERSIASALACQHLARGLLALGAEFRQDSARFGEPEAESAELPFLKAAIRAFNASIKYYGQLESAYLDLATTHGKLAEHNKAAAVLGQLVAVNPDNFDAHCRLAFHYLNQDEPGKSEPHVAAAVRLHPRDERTVDLRWIQQETMIRCLAQKRQFAAAELELDKASAAVPDHVEPYTLPLLRAGLAWKAKQAESAEQHLKTALETIEEPTAVWMQMTYVADRFKLPAEVRRDFDRRFKKALESTPTGPTAARLARFFTMLRESETNYTGRATQERLFSKYLQRVKGDELSLHELQNVCRFLTVPESNNLPLGKALIVKGVQRFPESAYLQMMAGAIEMLRGPFACDYAKARAHMQRAVDLAKDSTDKDSASIIERAQHGLTVLNSESPFESRRSYDDEEECDCPQCRAQRAASAFAEWDNDDDDDDDYDMYVDDDDDDDDDDDELDGNPLADLTAAQQAELFAMVARMANRTPEEVREAVQRMAQNGGAGPQPENLKRNRARSADRGTKRRR